MVLIAQPDGGTGIGLQDASGKPRASLFTRPDGSPLLGLFNAEGKPLGGK